MRRPCLLLFPPLLSFYLHGWFFLGVFFGTGLILQFANVDGPERGWDVSTITKRDIKQVLLLEHHHSMVKCQRIQRHATLNATNQNPIKRQN